MLIAIIYCFHLLSLLDEPKYIEWGSWTINASITDTPPVEEATQEVYSRPYEQLIHDTFGEDGDIAYAIAQAEHNGTINPDAVNSTEVEHSIGIFQINVAKEYGNGAYIHWNKIPGDTLEDKEVWLKVPENNVLIAKFLYGSSGFYPWSVYKNKRYLKYLK